MIRNYGDEDNRRKLRTSVAAITLISVLLFVDPLLSFPIGGSPTFRCSEDMRRESPGTPYVTTRKNATIEFLSVLQMPGGAFVAFLDDPSYGAGPIDTERAVWALSIIGGIDTVDVEAVVNYSLNCQTDAGGFVIRPEWVSRGYTPDLVSTMVAIMILDQLSALNRVHSVPKLLDWVASCYNSATGGFSNQPGYAEDVWATSDGLVVLSTFGALNRIDAAKTLHHLVTDYYQDDGGFSLGPSKGEATGEITTRPALQALACINGLGSIPDRTKTINYILSTCG